ncbi:hypothetical protein GMRT_jh011 [Giardia muris]|uniref:Uncharacterized protein n=1 Tax=Giardia muris TaxID=5742 RepID=A0A4Z1T8H6_GIAMU|nr:hypothetical protein GMRT_jh011 [Giardia muris]|eukprot:TNJ30423.1 hypothetical protein GMRT_jh011 [Giardia muris]
MTAMGTIDNKLETLQSDFKTFRENLTSLEQEVTTHMRKMNTMSADLAKFISALESAQLAAMETSDKSTATLSAKLSANMASTLDGINKELMKLQDLKHEVGRVREAWQA